MGKKAGRCNNYDGCSKALQSTPIEADEFNFVCPSCGKPLKPLIRSASRTGPNWPLLAGLGLAAAVAAGGGAYLLATRDSNPPPPTNAVSTIPQNPAPVPVAENSESGKCSPPPLLMEGKRSLYQRILTLPGAALVAEPGGNGGAPLASLQRFYVYGRQESGGKQWLYVGATANCKREGWIAIDRTVPWNQQITVAFDNPAGRDRVLVFEKDGDLTRIATSPNPGPELDRLQASVKAKHPDERIISAEPENYVDFSQHPYLLPIVDFHEITHRQGFPVQLLKIHSISKNAPAPSVPAEARPPKAAVVFVIDSTVSMKKYIDNTKSAVKIIFDRLRQSPGGAGIDFGLVVFRSSIKAVPALEYVTKVLVRPEDEDNKAKFIKEIDGVEEARVSSRKFDEDAYAGIDEALKMLQKEATKSYESRHVILVTDAGPLRSTDELSSKNKTSKDLLQKAKDSPRVWLYAMHLKTAKGLEVGDHPGAEREYRDLTKNVETGDSLYYPVENAGSPADFKSQIDCLAGFVANISAHNAEPSQIATLCPPVPSNPQLNETLKRMRSHAIILGRALQMEYLGWSSNGKGVPDDFEGWIAERDLKQPIRPSVDVRVLLTKNELNNLSSGVKTILDAAEANKTSPEQFYNSLLDFTAKMGRDSARAKPKENISIADMGLLGEYLDGLPYKSQVMSLDQETWANYSASQQADFIQSLKTRLERYQDYEADNALWWPKNSKTEEGNNIEEGEKIYPVPLDALP